MFVNEVKYVYMHRIWSKKYPICIVLSPGAQLGVRYRKKSDETVDPNAPWVEDENYNFETVSEGKFFSGLLSSFNLSVCYIH